MVSHVVLQRTEEEDGITAREHRDAKSEACCLGLPSTPTLVLPSSTQQILSRKQENSPWANSFSRAPLLFVKINTFCRRSLLTTLLKLVSTLTWALRFQHPAQQTPAKMIPGGLTEAKPATPEIQEIANEVSWCRFRKMLLDTKSQFIAWTCVEGVGERENQSTGRNVAFSRLSCR